MDRGMDKNDVVHIYNEILVIKKHETIFAAPCMDLRIVILSK